jgi:hypothetical protein
MIGLDMAVRPLGLAIAVAACVAASTPAFQAPPQDTLTLNAPGAGSAAARLTRPSADRSPVVLIEGGAPPDLDAALAARGVASVRADSATGEVDAQIARTVAWLELLRNDERFPIVAVLGAGDRTPLAAIAARIARADGFVAADDAARKDAAAEVAKLIAPVLTSHTAASDASQIADFVRDLPALGRRGSSRSRPYGPRRSLRHAVLATIGGTRVAIEYGQPSKRGRTIWGVLVPWNQIWMPGADEATTLTTDRDIAIGSVTVPGGDHTFYVWPDRQRTQLVVSNDVGQFHTVYDARKELGRVDLTMTERSDAVELLTFALESRGAAGVLKMMWDTREYTAPIAIKGPR